MGSKSGDQVLQDSHDDANDALRVNLVAGGGVTPPTTTVLRSELTGAGAIALTTAFAKKMQILSIRGHASAAVVEALIISLDSKTGGAYDSKDKEVSAGWTDFKYLPDGEDILEAGDEIAIACANSGGATFGITVIAKELS